MGGDRCGKGGVAVSGGGASLAWRADMVVYEEREEGDRGEGGYRRLEHIWEETWQAPRRADKYGPGIGGGMMMSARRGGQAPGDRRGCGGGRSASADAIECDFGRLEAIWDAWWSVPRRAVGRQDAICGKAEGKAVEAKAGRLEKAVGGDRRGDAGLEAGSPVAGSPVAGSPAAAGHHRRSRSWTGTEFNRMAGPWPLWQAGVESIPGFDINALNGACQTSEKN
ncbi:unnamed protein product [Ostreobium quekettii]|uniref:Uncharacterized protein n=1 Tax=Ostreobium quekettii TaxID=121088 RepID=A0A8S1INM8_9CHLO|nr:unnamed protein product [Ostreobium quekettii]|eukprot:evm.model.scf_744EXC.3 EVM.evm.TU.scf_744EXC.3   scf_744EXC:15588-17421(+)